jgi:lipoyl(octanoyl) transferase
MTTVLEAPPGTGTGVLWKTARDPVSYQDGLHWMEGRVAEIGAGTAPETVWLLEHPPVYTAGTSARPEDLLTPDRFPVFKTGRGGQYTYHGPGQRVAYVMLDLGVRGRDLRKFVNSLEKWLIRTLGDFGVEGETRPGRVGVWVRHRRDGGIAESKIAALGIRIRRWVSYHGISLNVSPDLGHFAGIVPCGVREHGVTSLADLGIAASMPDVDRSLRHHFQDIFGPIRT